MHLTERGGGGGGLTEFTEQALPIGSQFAVHPPAHKGPPHGRGIRLQLAQLVTVFLGQGVGNGGGDLGHFHQRSLEPTQGGGQLGGVVGAVEADT